MSAARVIKRAETVTWKQSLTTFSVSEQLHSSEKLFGLVDGMMHLRVHACSSEVIWAL